MKNRFKLFLSLILLQALMNLGNAQTVTRYEGILPIYDRDRFLGEVKVIIEDEKILSIDKKTLVEAIQGDIQAEMLEQFLKLNEVINPIHLPLPVKLNNEELKLELSLGIEQRSKEKLELLEDYHRRYESEAIRPASFGGAINTRLEQTWTNNPNENNFFSGQFDSFLNLNSLVFENQSFYQSDLQNSFYRGDARLVKDFEQSQIRVQAGDVNPQIQGFMVGRPIGGINIARNFSLNPYRLPYPTGTQDFVLQSRSLVKYFVNGTMIKSEYLPAGNYTARDIPLNNGLNTILIEATDDLGQKKVFVFKSAASINLLNAGESRFDISYGTPFFDQNFKRQYRYNEGELLSSFFQYGFSSSFSASVYLQNQQDFTLAGSEIIKATNIGNIGLGYANSKNTTSSGQAQSISYQFLGSGTKWYFSHSLGLRYEHRNEEFKSTSLDGKSIVQNSYAANYALPVSGYLTVSIGGNFGDVRDNKLNDRYGFDSTLNLRLFDRHNLSFFVGRNRDENKIWNDVAYLFLTITFPDSNDFVSTFYDQKQKNTKVTYIHDNQNRLYSPKAQAIVENNQSSQQGEADLLFPTPIADLGARMTANHILSNDKIYHKGSVRLNSSLVFAKNDKEWGLGLSRPVPSSFVIFKPEKRLSDQKIALKSTSPYTEAQSGIFGEITFSNLLPYQYREIQLDPTLMDEGRTLQKEKYVLYPTYRSSHLIKLEDKGAVMIKGRLYRPDGKPWSLQVGSVGDKSFFTNRDGDFFIEGIEAGKHFIRLEGLESYNQILISTDDKGIKNIGSITLGDEE